MGATKIPFQAFSENFRSQKPPLQTMLINSLMESNTFFFSSIKVLVLIYILKYIALTECQLWYF